MKSINNSVALRKESVDRNSSPNTSIIILDVALRKESVDRNHRIALVPHQQKCVALRKESVDRNCTAAGAGCAGLSSLSARRAWIEIHTPRSAAPWQGVALRKESVDRNNLLNFLQCLVCRRSPQGERG